MREGGFDSLAQAWHRLGINGVALQGLVELRGQRALKETLRKDLGVTDTRTLLAITGHIMVLFRLS